MCTTFTCTFANHCPAAKEAGAMTVTMATPIDRITTVASRSEVGFPRDLEASSAFLGHVCVRRVYSNRISTMNFH